MRYGRENRPRIIGRPIFALHSYSHAHLDHASSWIPSCVHFFHSDDIIPTYNIYNIYIYIHAFFSSRATNRRWLVYLAKLSPGEWLSCVPPRAYVVGEDDAAKIAQAATAQLCGRTRCHGHGHCGTVPRHRVPLAFSLRAFSLFSFLSLSPSRFHPPPYVSLDRMLRPTFFFRSFELLIR